MWEDLIYTGISVFAFLSIAVFLRTRKIDYRPSVIAQFCCCLMLILMGYGVNIRYSQQTDSPLIRTPVAAGIISGSLLYFLGVIWRRERLDARNRGKPQ
jgi:hypothetical protein